MPEIQTDDAGQVISAKLMFSGDFVDQATIIPTSNSTMILTTALREEDQTPVLLPFIETKVGGIRLGAWIELSAQDDDAEDSEETIDIDDFEPLMSVTLPLDNALFFAYDFVRDMQIACTQMANLSGGFLALEPSRLQIARHFAMSLQDQSAHCVQAIDRLITGAEVITSEGATV